MNKILNLVIFISFIGCSQTHQSKLANIKEFTKIYLDSVSKHFPEVQFKMIDDSTIESTFRKKLIRTSLDNPYKDYLTQPDSLHEILTKFTMAESELYTEEIGVSAENIVPIIRSIGYLNDVKNAAKEMGASKDVEGVYEKYNDQLIILYAADSKTTVRYLTHNDLLKLSIKTDSIRPLATKNLDRILTSIQKKGSDGVYMVTAGGNYEASIILLDTILSKKKFEINGDLVIAIPNRDMLLITGSNDETGIAKITALTQKSYNTGSYPVSQYLYKWNGTLFKIFR